MKGFGAFLVERGIASVASVIEALDRQRQTQKPIGRLAVESRLLTMKQLFLVLDHQVFEKHEFFGEIALSMDLLTESQLEGLLREQRRGRKPLGEILVELGHLTREQLEEELHAFSER